MFLLKGKRVPLRHFGGNLAGDPKQAINVNNTCFGWWHWVSFSQKSECRDFCPSFSASMVFLIPGVFTSVSVIFLDFPSSTSFSLALCWPFSNFGIHGSQRTGQGFGLNDNRRTTTTGIVFSSTLNIYSLVYTCVSETEDVPQLATMRG